MEKTATQREEWQEFDRWRTGAGTKGAHHYAERGMWGQAVFKRKEWVFPTRRFGGVLAHLHPPNTLSAAWKLVTVGHLPSITPPPPHPGTTYIPRHSKVLQPIRGQHWDPAQAGVGRGQKVGYGLLGDYESLIPLKTQHKTIRPVLLSPLILLYMFV